MKKRRVLNPCKKRGCNKSRYRDNLCREHWYEKRGPLPCKFKGCDKNAVAKGYCNYHWEQNHLGRKLTPIPEKVHYDHCTVRGCKEPHLALGLCTKHYNKQYELGDVNARTIYDKNKVTVRGKVAYLQIYNGKTDPNEVLFTVKFDSKFVDKVKPYKWRVHGVNLAHNHEVGYLFSFLMDEPKHTHIHFKDGDSTNNLLSNLELRDYSRRSKGRDWKFPSPTRRRRTVFGEKFYVYVYLDKRKPGKFVYTLSSGKRVTFSFEPFYVGKGSGSRAFYVEGHSDNQYLMRKLKRVLKETKLDIKDIVRKKFVETEAQALRLEMDYIQAIGRKGDGPLTNLSDGGSGGWGVFRGKDHTLYNSKNKKVEITNLTQFCREKGLVRNSIGLKRAGEQIYDYTWKPRSKYFTGKIGLSAVLKSPRGKEVLVSGALEFCQSNPELKYEGVLSLIKGWKDEYKGWTLVKSINQNGNTLVL